MMIANKVYIDIYFFSWDHYYIIHTILSLSRISRDKEKYNIQVVGIQGN